MKLLCILEVQFFVSSVVQNIRYIAKPTTVKRNRPIIMAKLTIEGFKKLCKLNLGKRYFKEILETIISTAIKFSPGIVQSKG
ncbi:MAG: hypothetical protein EAY75_09215 [Bacteroidetes bacterium]|nr:MAG: hypothetical protein EAY75_09215 [Bacteroidota bacterium]